VQSGRKVAVSRSREVNERKQWRGMATYPRWPLFPLVLGECATRYLMIETADAVAPTPGVDKARAPLKKRWRAPPSHSTSPPPQRSMTPIRPILFALVSAHLVFCQSAAKDSMGKSAHESIENPSQIRSSLTSRLNNIPSRDSSSVFVTPVPTRINPSGLGNVVLGSGDGLRRGVLDPIGIHGNRHLLGGLSSLHGTDPLYLQSMIARNPSILLYNPQLIRQAPNILAIYPELLRYYPHLRSYASSGYNSLGSLGLYNNGYDPYYSSNSLTSSPYSRFARIPSFRTDYSRGLNVNHPIDLYI